ncbi:hypothetical protein GPALN_012075 [Globodera pallida]|nr:hypothetical protein GPALN_012075 [Globodera pallida]
MFSESIERLCHQLLDFGENEQNKFMASTIKSKLPFNLLTQVIEKEMASGGTFNCSDLRRAITSIVEAKDIHQAGVQNTQLREPEENGSRSSKGVSNASKQGIIRSNALLQANVVNAERPTTS